MEEFLILNKNFLLAIFFILILTGCLRTIPNLNERKATAFSLVSSKTQNIKQKTINTKLFDIFTFETNLNNCKNIKVFIEGDGLAWITRTIISKDPTPLNPISLKLMLKDANKCKIYMARPCQYANFKSCNKKYWTSHRFSSKIINSYQEALNSIKTKYKNNSYTLLGFSGGGAIATILSAKRDDIKKLITIAGNLDTKAWTDYHNISALKGSLNPADFTKDLEDTLQYHFVGTKDKIMPKEIFDSFQSKFKDKSNIYLFLIDSGHNDYILKTRF